MSETAPQKRTRLTSTVMCGDEWASLLAWRELFLDPEREEPLLPPDPQLVCYAIADCMTFRELVESLPEPIVADGRHLMNAASSGGQL